MFNIRSIATRLAGRREGFDANKTDTPKGSQVSKTPKPSRRRYLRLQTHLYSSNNSITCKNNTLSFVKYLPSLSIVRVIFFSFLTSSPALFTTSDFPSPEFFALFLASSLSLRCFCKNLTLGGTASPNDAANASVSNLKTSKT